MTTGGDFWDHEMVDPLHNAWMALLPVRFYINESISGRAGGWPLDWFQETYPGIHFRRTLSVGCGTGPLERDLIRRNLSDVVDAFDASIASLHLAREAAKAERMADRIRYFAADFNEPKLPKHHYDAVFFHQSLHHVWKLEKLLRAVLYTVKPGGLVYLDEMIGPSRTYWTKETHAPWVKIWRSLPKEFQPDDIHLPIIVNDPSEAARSSEIMTQLEIGFEVTHFRGYGGNVLALTLPQIPNPPEWLIQHLISLEKERLNQGEPPFLAVIVARPKDGWRKLLARARYFAVPKLKRIGRELVGMLNGRRRPATTTAAAE